jgi:hypothetical protein
MRKIIICQGKGITEQMLNIVNSLKSNPKRSFLQKNMNKFDRIS